jgi:hypothetical protein
VIKAIRVILLGDYIKKMDFEPRHKQHWSQATEPQSLKDQWGVLESYIYVISKEFKPFDDEESLHLVKLGMSKFESFDNSYKGLSRLAGLKTSLISFKVHRLYLYDSFDTNTKSTRAFKAEQQLHSAIEEHFKPDKVRVKFRGHASIKDLDPKTEWFVIAKKQMPEFLKWLDDQVFYEISPVAVYGTAFTARASNPIEIDKEKSAAAEMELDVVAKRTRAKRGVLTQLQSKYAKSERQTNAEVAAAERRKNELEQHAKLRATLRKTPEFFQRELVKQRFTDPDLDGEKWQDKIITDVDYFETPEGKKYRNMRVLYEPAPRKRGEKELKQKDLDKYGGVLTIPEALHYFPKLKKKYEEIYDWYVAAERLDEERIGQELAGSGADVLITKSPRKDKKYAAVMVGKTVHFGAAGMSDYTLHGDEMRKERYLRRHQKRENWKDIHTAGFWSRWLLWNKPSLAESIADIESRFKISVYRNLAA